MDDDTEPVEIGPGKPVHAFDLTPGTVIRRWTDNAAPGWVHAPLPCHDEQSVHVPADTMHAVVICRVCSESFQLRVHDDNDGGYSAVYTVEYVPHLLSRKRSAPSP